MPTASISAFLGTSAGIPHGTERTAGNQHQGNVRNNARGTRRRRQFRPRQRNTVAAAVRHRLQSPGTARHPLETLPTSGTGSNPVTMKGTLPGAALPPCRRPQRGSQSRERPPSAARRRIKPRTQPAGSTAGRHPGSDQGNRQDDHRESPRSARPQRRSGTPKRRRTRPQRVKAGRDRGTTAARAYRLDFDLSRYVRRELPAGRNAA